MCACLNISQSRRKKKKRYSLTCAHDPSDTCNENRFVFYNHASNFGTTAAFIAIKVNEEHFLRKKRKKTKVFLKLITDTWTTISSSNSSSRHGLDKVSGGGQGGTRNSVPSFLSKHGGNLCGCQRNMESQEKKKKSKTRER